MYYEINVSKDGSHFFATAKRSITTKKRLIEVLQIIMDKFPKEHGYHIMASRQEETGVVVGYQKDLTIQDVEDNL